MSEMEKVNKTLERFLDSDILMFCLSLILLAGFLCFGNRREEDFQYFGDDIAFNAEGKLYAVGDSYAPTTG
jgi:hypothetical protein